MIVLSLSDQPEVPLDKKQHRFFEGAEKRLCIYFTNSASTSAVPPDLRSISQESWEIVLDLVNCKVLSTIANDKITAYLLSESSMFITRNRVLIKTCGTTTLLNCLPRLLDLALGLGFRPLDVYYSHKNLILPETQKSPHQSFETECEFLNKNLFRDETGFVTTFESPNHNINEDRFFLYASSFHKSDQNKRGANKHEHFKFEMMMEQLDDAIMDQFIFKNKAPLSAAEMTAKSGIENLIPGIKLDSFAFEGCGYSMNGICDAHYMTIHVTPQAAFSFVSLETDVPMVDYAAFIKKVFYCFKPHKFMINLMAPKYGNPQIGDVNRQEFVKLQLNGLTCLEVKLAHCAELNVIYARFGSAE